MGLFKQLRIFFHEIFLRKLKSINISGLNYMAGLVKFDFPVRLQNHQRQESYQKHFNTNWSLDGISKSSLIQEALIECQPEFSSVECQRHPACSLGGASHLVRESDASWEPGVNGKVADSMGCRIKEEQITIIVAAIGNF